MNGDFALVFRRRDRVVAVAGLRRQGLSQRAIAARLGISQGTVWGDLRDQNLIGPNADAHVPLPDQEMVGVPDLLALLAVIEGLMTTDIEAAAIAAGVPRRRRGATARRLRNAGTHMGRIALALERLEEEV